MRFASHREPAAIWPGSLTSGTELGSSLMELVPP
jgi:hypothetical protein